MNMNGNKKANTRRNRGRAAWLWLSIVLCLALLMGTAALAEGLVDENTALLFEVLVAAIKKD